MIIKIFFTLIKKKNFKELFTDRYWGAKNGSSKASQRKPFGTFVFKGVLVKSCL